MKWSGWKSYLVAAAMAAATLAHAKHWIDDATYQTIMGVLAPTGLVTLRHGVTTEAAKVTADAAVVADTEGKVNG